MRRKIEGLPSAIVAALAGGAEGRGFVADRAETPGADVFAVTE